MKGIRLEELIAEIRANFVAFFSIMMFVCLGIGLFWGIKWSGAALQGAAEQAFEAGALHDIELMYPYGLTGDDLEQIKATEGVSDAELAYVSYATVAEGEVGSVLKIHGLTERINQPQVVEGRLPERPQEAAIIAKLAETAGISVGDTIVLSHDAADESADPDGMRELTCDKLVVVGILEHPAYLSGVESTFGVAPFGTGTINGIVFVHNSSFDSAAFREGFPCAYVRCDTLRACSTFEDAYYETSLPVIDALSALGETQAKARHAELRADAQRQIDDAAAEVADAEAKIEDARDEIARGEQDLATSEQQLEEGARQLEDGVQQLAAGEQQLSAGEQQIADGAQQLADAEGKLDAGEQEIAKKQRELAQKRKQLKQAQSSYDEQKEQLEGYEQTYQNSLATFEKTEPAYQVSIEAYGLLQQQRATLGEQLDALDEAIAAYEESDANPEATDDERDAAWAEVQSAYDAVAATHAQARVTYDALVTGVSAVFAAYDQTFEPQWSELPALSELSREDPGAAAASGQTAMEAIDALVTQINELEFADPDGYTYSYLDMPGSFERARTTLDGMQDEAAKAKRKLDDAWDRYREAKKRFDSEAAKAKDQIAQARQELAPKRAQLDEARQTLAAKRAEYEAALAAYQEKKAAYENGTVALAQGKEELEEAKRALEEKRGEVENAKQQVEDAASSLDDLREYAWFVISRTENGGVAGVATISTMMEHVRWAMALLFVLVGLFVCYAAILRLVHDEAAQIGTKKAMGFREGEIATGYLAFSGLAVLMGTALAAGVATLVVEGIINPATSRSFRMPPLVPHFDLAQLLLGGGIELVLILLSTWLAIHGMLKRTAIFLLNGGREGTAKTRPYERTRLWNRLSLYSQTIVNNCVNDKRRVAATLIGVVGCTSLIVSAVTLQHNVSRSFDRHYERVYAFDTVISLSDDVPEASQNVRMALADQGFESAEMHNERLRVQLPNGRREMTSLFVPTDGAAFEQRYHLNVTEGAKDLEGDGLLVSTAFARHNNVGVGDTVELIDAAGQTHAFAVAGITEFYLLRHEFVLGVPAYRASFGEEPQANALMAQLGEADRSQVSASLAAVEGYDALKDDYTASHYSYGELARILKTVVMVYLGLSALMALIVLLNLDIMFVEERKRELITLMINGFSVRDAKAYIYRDSLVLTALGIVLGVVFGAVMGVMTVSALEPSAGWFVKSFSIPAALIGTVGAGVLSVAVLLYALRRIPRFKLSDINRV